MSEWTEPDWKQVLNDLRRFILHRVRARYRRPIDDDILADGVASGVARLYRWCCREREQDRQIDSLEAMMNRVANFVAIDILRILIGAEQVDRIDPAEPIAAPPPKPPFDEAERMRYAMLAFFERENAPCVRLAHPYFANLRWQAVADEMQLEVDTVKQRWSRCVRAFKAFLSEDPAIESWIFEDRP